MTALRTILGLAGAVVALVGVALLLLAIAAAIGALLGIVVVMAANILFGTSIPLVYGAVAGALLSLLTGGGGE